VLQQLADAGRFHPIPWIASSSQPRRSTVSGADGPDLLSEPRHRRALLTDLDEQVCQAFEEVAEMVGPLRPFLERN
jgi:hypothetical protein